MSDQSTTRNRKSWMIFIAKHAMFLMAIASVCSTEAVTTVYNLRVADHHTYFVGGDEWGWDVWVHNAGYNRAEGLKANKKAGDSARDAILSREAPALAEQNLRVSGGLRRVDVLKEGGRIVAFESKVGRTNLGRRGGNNPVRQELARDVKLLRSGQVDEVVWEFSRSSVTGKIGPSRQLLEKLDKFGISVNINY